MLISFILDYSYEKRTNIYTAYFIWNLYYLIIHLSYKPREITPKLMDLKNRIVAVTHGLLSKYLSFYCIFFIKINNEAENIWFVNFVLLNSLGYFMYDSFAMFYYNLWDKSIVLHHFMSISGILVSYFSNLGGYFVLVGLIMAEISNWPMHVRKMLKDQGLRYTRIYETLEILYFALYFLGRVIFGPYLIYLGFKIKNIPWPIFLLCMGILIQSVLFSKTMISILKNKLLQKKERRNNQLHYWWFSVNPKILELPYTKKTEKQKVF